MSLPLALRVSSLRLAASRTGDTQTHGEDLPRKINSFDHPERKASSGFQASKALATKILHSIGVDNRFLGSEALQMHHGVSLWILGDDGWFMLQNEAGIDWSGQVCADLSKVNCLGQNAQRLYTGFPTTTTEMVRLGYRKAQEILDMPITDAQTIATRVDSLFNVYVFLPAIRHVGVLPKGGGRHHYPTPITDIRFGEARRFSTLGHRSRLAQECCCGACCPS